MPSFDAKSLNADPDGLTLLARVLHPTKQDRSEALRRGRERLAQANPFGTALMRKPSALPGGCLTGLPTA